MGSNGLFSKVFTGQILETFGKADAGKKSIRIFSHILCYSHKEKMLKEFTEFFDWFCTNAREIAGGEKAQGEKTKDFRMLVCVNYSV